MATPQESRTYWSGLAAAYSLLDSPLLPSTEDIRTIKEAVARWLATHAAVSVKALLLGVTPAIANMEWPGGSWLLGVDNSAAMLGSVWPGDVPNRRSAVCGDWRAVPAADSSVNVVIGDGSFSCVRYPDALRAVVAEMHRVLTADGILILRCYLQSDRRDSPDDVIEDLLRGAIPTFHAFKLRLLISMQQSPEEGVVLDKVYRYWNSRRIDADDLALRTGWPAALVRSLELYRGTSTVHAFPTLMQLRAVLAPYFDEISLSTPSYPLGERCPILMAAPRHDDRSGEARCSR